MNRFLRLGMTLSVVIFILATCTFSPRQDLALKIDSVRLAEKLRGTKLSNLSCFFVSVTGPGVPFDFGPYNLGKRDPACMGLGRVSKLTSLSALGKTGVTIKTTAGAKRNIRILGAETTLPNCSGLTFDALFADNRRPAIYEVAHKETDIYVDSKVVVSESNDLTTAKDIVAPCDFTGVIGGGNSGGTTNTAVARSAKVALLIEQNNQKSVRLYGLDKDLLLSAEGNDFLIPSFTNPEFILQPDARGLILFQSSSTVGAQVQGFTIDVFGQLTELGSQTLNHAGRNLSFSADSSYAYIPETYSFYQKNVVGGVFSDLMSHGACSMAGTDRLLATPSQMFYFLTDTVSVSGTSTDGNYCDLAKLNAGPIVGSAAQASFSNKGVLYVASSRGSLGRVASFLPDSNGAWTTNAGGTVDGAGSGLLFGLDPFNRFVFIIDYYAGTLTSYAMNADGTLNVLPRSQLFVSNPNSISVDPLGRSVFVTSADVSLLEYSFNSEGLLSYVTQSGFATPTHVYRVQTIPVY